MNNVIIRGFLLVMIVFISNTFLYFSFGNIYSAHLFNYEAFTQQYSNGIYKYRFLSTEMVKWLYEQLNHQFPKGVPIKAGLTDKTASINLFVSFYVINTVFLVLSSIVMLIITETKRFFATSTEKFSLCMLAIFSVLLSQFVIVPYDCSSYFLLLLFFLILIKYIHQPKSSLLIALVITLIISTLNRESAALSLSLATVLLLSKFEISTKSVKPLSILTISFITVYCLLRYYFGGFSTNDGNLLAENFTNINALLGIGFACTFFILVLALARGQQQLKHILGFHFFAIPYILMCFYSGYLYEIRLYIPIFITSIFLTRFTLDEELY